MNELDKTVFITGGAGYVGAELVPALLEKGYKVTVLDLFIYGKNVISKNENLKLIQGDIRDQELLKKEIKNHNYLIHLACISNDPSFELNPELGKSINLDAFEPMVKIAKDNGVKRFVYASSSSVYGIKKEKEVVETMKLEPLTDYSKYKAKCEDLLFKHSSENFQTTVVRPATVCGYSKRQRLDVIVNILTNHAFHKKRIKLFGGDQLRPNLHIKDMVNAYEVFLTAEKSQINEKIFNVGTENLSVEEIGNKVVKEFNNDVEVMRVPTDDKRSYHISSKKISQELGFMPKFKIENAIRDLKNALEKGYLKNSFENEMYFNIKMMNKLNLK